MRNGDGSWRRDDERHQNVLLDTTLAPAVLKAEGCNEGQGYLFSKARPQADVLEMLARQATQAA